MENEDTIIFRGYLRGLLRELKRLRTTIHEHDFEKAEILIDELVDDTQKNIED